MLARLESSLPRGAEWRYEPKLDGFRGLLWRSGTGQVRLLSRNLKDLSPLFPELLRAGDSLPPDTVLDGEIVIADDKGCADFGALQERLEHGPACCESHDAGQAGGAADLRRGASRQGADLTGCPLRERRTVLEGLLAENIPFLQLIAQTHMVEEAEEWLRLLAEHRGRCRQTRGRPLPGRSTRLDKSEAPSHRRLRGHRRRGRPHASLARARAATRQTASITTLDWRDAGKGCSAANSCPSSPKRSRVLRKARFALGGSTRRYPCGVVCRPRLVCEVGVFDLWISTAG